MDRSIPVPANIHDECDPIMDIELNRAQRKVLEMGESRANLLEIHQEMPGRMEDCPTGNQHEPKRSNNN
jgi:hypothetical protein